MSDKRSKETVDYTPRAAKMSERCKLCEFFRDTHMLYGECERVRGTISPRGWCELFQRKRATKSAA